MSDIVTAATAARAALGAAAGGTPVAVVTAFRAGTPVLRLVVRDDGTEGSLGSPELDAFAERLARTALAQPGAEPLATEYTAGTVTWQLFIETHRAPDHLIIVGAGHIAVPLAHLGALLGFRVTVLDDREEMVEPGRFDDRVAVVRSDFATDPFAGVRIDGDSYIALVTRGHKWDFDCLRRIVAGGVQPRYLGMIGSRRRVRAAFSALLESGVPRAVLAVVRAPIGLELNAETPAEIAVAIAAEIVAVRRGAEIASTSSRERVLERFLNEA